MALEQPSVVSTVSLLRLRFVSSPPLALIGSSCPLQSYLEGGVQLHHDNGVMFLSNTHIRSCIGLSVDGFYVI